MIQNASRQRKIHQPTIEARLKDLNAVKQSILDDSKIVKKGVSSIPVKIYPEFYFKELKFFADLVIVEMDMTLQKIWLSEKMTDIAAIIELKCDSGNAISTSDYIKTDMPKLKEYIHWLNYDCQYYFGVIYENDCEWLHWFDKRSTNHWANGRLTELNAGYLGETMYFEVNSYNNMNFQQKRTPCNVIF
jgi:hypothetical protein